MITEILLHDIDWWVYDDEVTELDECSIEHIEKCIKDGISQGELCISYFKDENDTDPETTWGWWKIKK